MKLVVIEGVGKKDTIKKYLGSDFEVFATKGHVRDLPTKTLGVNIQDNFTPQYEIIPDKKDVVKSLKEAYKKADKIYLATDPDREGEAISWHLCNILGIDEKEEVRIVFNEISKKAVTEAIKNPRAIDKNLVNAQQARRVLDRLVGYKLSPIICKKVQPKLSAGRVQSVALKLVVDREKEIKAFNPVEYWTLIANLFTKASKEVFGANLVKFNAKKLVINNKQEMDAVLDKIKNGHYIVKSVKKSVGKTHPTAPYTTSTMQQDALNKLGFSLKRTGSCAQELYEGVALGSEGKTALVTYIRTDSVRVAPDAIAMAREYISDNFGKNYLPENPNYFKTKASAQDAHEAIRPISIERSPENVKPFISADNYKLYKLIYNKFLASQMADATYNSVIAEIDNNNYTFKATGKTPVFDGFTVLYNIDKKPVKKQDEDDNEIEEIINSMLPEMKEGEILNLKELLHTQKFTKAPARFTEATLVKEMEERGIGRPATYQPTITVITSRNYVMKDGKSLKPTELGEKVTDLLDKFFSDIINVTFTAAMEDSLDNVAEHDLDWHNMIKEFYDDFAKELVIADKDSVKFKVEPKPTDEKCDKCGSPMVIRTGRYGEFMACSNFPACKNIKGMENKNVGKCPKCGKQVLERKSKKGKIFYGCSGYPECAFISWEIPTEEKCPKCSQYLTKKPIYGNVRMKCSNETCDYSVTLKKENQE